MKYPIIALAVFTFASSAREVIKVEESPKENAAAPVIKGHVFAWPFTTPSEMQPRGGTTTGSEVTLALGEGEAWKKLQESGLFPREKDRRAILAMVGNYRVSFDFTELLGLTADFQPKSPYFSWATENVQLLEEREDFISLQHTLVMFFKDKDGKVSEPMVMKHWRQDWTYQDKELCQFRGKNTWEIVPNQPTAGQWSHAVFQVDDSPRYESTGKWTHTGAQSTWRGQAWRPLPRREFSVRDDYHVLSGTDEITLTPNGWVHFQNNGKIKLGTGAQVIGREIGVNRYERITAPSLAAAGEQWEKVQPYWAEVRAAWKDVFKNHPRFTIRNKVEKQKLFMHHFGYAAQILKDGYDAEAGKKHARETVAKFTEGAAPNDEKY